MFKEYLDNLQTDAIRLRSALDGVLILHNEGTKEAHEAAYDILEIIAPLASSLSEGLDLVNRPAETSCA